MNKNPPYQTKRKRNNLHFQICQNKILNQTLILMRLNIKKIHIHLKHCKTTQTIHDNDDLIHDENNTSENENIIQIETFEHYGEKIHETEESIPTETSQVLTVFNKRIHHEDDSSDDKSDIEIEPSKRIGSKKLENRTNSLLPHFNLKLKTEKLKGSEPIQQINKY